MDVYRPEPLDPTFADVSSVQEPAFPKPTPAGQEKPSVPDYDLLQRKAKSLWMVLKSKFGVGARVRKKKALREYLEFIGKQSRSHIKASKNPATTAYNRERLPRIAEDLIKSRDQLISATGVKLSQEVSILEWVACARQSVPSG